MINNIISNKVEYKKQITNLVDTNRRLLDYEARVLENRVTPRIPKEYKKQEYLFQEEISIVVLPKYQPQNYEIVLQEGKQLTFRLIYGLLEKELKTLQDYIEVNVKKGFIQELISPIGYPILFTLKKNKKL